MSEGSTSPKRPRLEYDDSVKDDHHDKYTKNRDIDDQGSYSNSRKRRGDTDEDDLKDCDDIKSKTVSMDAGRREHTLVMRLTNKEQELQECMNQIQEMKQAQTQNTAQLRSMLLDPAINLVFQRMSKEMDEHKDKLKQKQNELNAWKFTPDSQTGMRLMGKCRMLLQENGELGKMISSGRTARLEGEISLHKALVGEMKKNQKELDEFVGELEEDVEGMQGMIFMLQQQLKEAKEQITRLQQENEQLRTLQLPTEPDPCSVTVKNGFGASSQIVNSSSHSSTDYLQPNRSLLLPNTLIPLSNLNDSALVSGSTDEFSPSSFSLKVTPDSGIQTQEEDDDASAYATDSPSVDEFARLNSADDCHNSEPDSNPRSTAKTPKSHLEDGLRTCPNHSEESEPQEENVRTTGPDDDHHDPTVSPSVPKSNIHERISPSDHTLTTANGDIQPTSIDDSECNSGDSEERTKLSPGEDSFSKERIGQDELDLKLTNSTSSDNVEGKIKHLLEESDSSNVNCSKLNLTNGSGDEVTSGSNVDTK